MKSASSSYLQEQRRLRGARPRIKAVVRPFDLDFAAGFGAGLGTFTNCSSPSSGVLRLDSGYLETASWVSDVLQTREGQYSHVIPSGIFALNCYSSNVFLRSAASYEEVSSEAWVQVAWDSEAAIGLYWQIKIELAISFRAWALDDAGEADDYNAYAVDGGSDSYLSYAADPEYPGEITDLKFSGLMELGEDDIIACGNLIAARPAFFHDIHGEKHVLTVDNRGRQWIPGHQDFLMQDGLWFGKEIHIYTGFDLPSGSTDWILQYVGRIRDIREITNSFTGKHQAKIYSNLLIHEVLSQIIGAPAADGTRRPYMAGYYKTRAELTETTDPYVGTVTKNGSGSATMQVLGTPTNTEDLDVVVEAESTGEIGTATIRYSVDGGNSWEKSGVVSMSSLSPFNIKNGLSIYFDYGAGNDLVAGDQFSFTAWARRTTYTVFGAPFQDITNVYFNGVEIFTATSVPSTGQITIVGNSGLVDARVVKDDLTNPVDIIEAILDSVGLTDYLDAVSFVNARIDLAEYQIGVRFEGIPAWKAIQFICTTCLIFFWIDANKIYVSAYTGESA